MKIIKDNKYNKIEIIDGNWKIKHSMPGYTNRIEIRSDKFDYFIGFGLLYSEEKMSYEEAKQEINGQTMIKIPKPKKIEYTISEYLDILDSHKQVIEWKRNALLLSCMLNNIKIWQKNKN